ncbi:hypothetical protein GCM10007207_00420 [Asaia siamensis]|uniref:Uncharacterized protein n=1 Tax=Asaia siamensis TaxID=110479 RepID=A0ABQ1L6T6_9PROT|nr:hypothetical protein GCM10007207_00420 [Asaia siamensis]
MTFRQITEGATQKIVDLGLIEHFVKGIARCKRLVILGIVMFGTKKFPIKIPVLSGKRRVFFIHYVTLPK